MDNFDAELKSYYLQVKDEIKKEHAEYLGEHPEIRDILNDFVSSLLLEKPENVYSYAKDYFSYFNNDEEVKTYHPLILVGPSGVGKGTMVKKLLLQYPEIFKLSVSWTSRNPRTGELHDREYHFVSKDQFEKEITEGGFVEYCRVHDNLYGTHKDQISKIVTEGKVCILEIDVQGAEKIKKIYPNATFIFINIPRLEELEQRLRSRQSETEQQVQIRMENARTEIDAIKRAGYFNEIMNIEIEDCFNNIVDFLKRTYPTINFNKKQNSPLQSRA